MVSHHSKVTEQNNMNSAIITFSNPLQCLIGITTWLGKLNKLCLIPEDLVGGFLCRHIVPVLLQEETTIT